MLPVYIKVHLRVMFINVVHCLFSLNQLYFFNNFRKLHVINIINISLVLYLKYKDQEQQAHLKKN